MTFPYSSLPNELKVSILRSFPIIDYPTVSRANRLLNKLLKDGHIPRRIDTIKVKLSEIDQLQVKIGNTKFKISTDTILISTKTVVAPTPIEPEKPKKSLVSRMIPEAIRQLFGKTSKNELQEENNQESLKIVKVDRSTNIEGRVIWSLLHRIPSFRCLQLDFHKLESHQIENFAKEYSYFISFLRSSMQISRLELKVPFAIAEMLIEMTPVRRLDLLKFDLNWQNSEQNNEVRQFLRNLQNLDLIKSTPIISWKGSEDLWEDAIPVTPHTLVYQLASDQRIFNTEWRLLLSDLLENEFVNRTFFFSQIGFGRPNGLLEEFHEQLIGQPLNFESIEADFQQNLHEMMPTIEKDYGSLQNHLKWLKFISAVHQRLYRKGGTLFWLMIFVEEWPKDQEYTFEDYLHHIDHLRVQMIVRFQ